MADLKLKILLEAVDKVTAPIRAIRTSATGLRSAVAETAEKLRGLERSAQQLAKFRELKTEARSNAQALEAAQARTQALSAAMRGADVVTNKMRREFAQASAEVRRLKDAQQRGAQELQTLRHQLRSAGVDTSRMASEQQRLRAAMAATTATAAQQAAALARVTARAKAMAAAKTKMEKTQGVAGNMAGAGAAGLATGGAGLAVLGKTASVGMDFEAVMSKVGALAKIDKTSDAFKKLEKQAFVLGATTSFSSSQAAEGMSNLAQAGWKADAILAAMPGMLNLAKAGTTDLGQTAAITANIMSGFGLKAEQMGDVGDVLVATFTNSNTTLEQLGETMKYVGPVAKAAGYSLGDMSVLAGLLGNVGIQGSEAGTALRAAILRLASPPTEAKKALDALGVSTKDALGNMRPMSSVLADLAEKTKKMGSAQKLEMFSKIFGVEAAAAMTELVDKAGSKGIKDFTATIKQAHGLNDKISAQMADNAKGDLDNLTSAIEGVQIILTKLNTQPLRDLMTWAAGVTTAFGEWMEANPELAATLSRIVAVVVGLIAAAGVLAITVAGVLGPFAILRFTLAALGLKAGAAIGALFGLGRAILFGVVPALWQMAAAALANPIVWIVLAIAAAAALLYVYWEPIAAFFSGVWRRVSTAMTDAWARIKATLGFDPVTVVTGYWDGLVTFFAGTWTKVSAAFTKGWADVKATLGFDPVTVVTSYWDGLVSFYTGIWSKILGAFDKGWADIEATLGFDPIATIKTAWDPVTTFFDELWDGLGLKFDDTWKKIQDKLASIRKVVDWAGKAWDSLFGSDDKKKDEKPPEKPPEEKKPPAQMPKMPATPKPPAMPAAPGAIRTPDAGAIVPVPAPPPAAANSNAPSAAPAAIHQTISITVNAAPGQDVEAIAREVKRQLDQQAARARSVARSALSDR